MYIFRNNTIEGLFDEGTLFSGYGDISDTPADERVFVWFYQAPVTLEAEAQINEVAGMASKLQLVRNSLPKGSSLKVLSLENLFPIAYVQEDGRLQDAIDRFNAEARQLSLENPNISFFDFGDFLSNHPSSEWINWRFYFISQMILNPKLVPDFKIWWVRQCNIAKGVRKKCLVLDLDNTLWGGVLGEDGISGIQVGGDYPGKAFLYFQEGLKSLADQGVILTVCSKNNESDVKEVWERNPFLVLRENDFAAWQINWENKADNIRRLASTLNIGLDSMVFVDDNPTERELVRQQLPMVAVPDFPKKPYELPVFFRQLVDDYFTACALTDEDRKKTEQYKANAKRASEQEHFSDLTDFIRSLKIEMTVSKADEFSLPRLAQMTQKTNQFNLTTRRYSEADISNIIAEGGEAWALSVKDKYGDNGITGEIILKINGDSAHIDTLLLSCRILGKRIENAFLATVLANLASQGVKTVTAEYIPTAKNSQVADFYSRLGFQLTDTDCDGTKHYALNTDNLPPIEDIYDITTK